MTRTTTLVTASIAFGILLFLVTASAYGQRGGRGGGVGAARGTGIGGAPSGVGGVGPSRRTAVIAGAARDGRIGDGRYGGRGYGGNLNHPVAAVAVARRVPIGTVIEVLPPDCSMTFVSEMEYYYCSGQYYQPMGSESNQIYVAAEPYVPQY